MDYKSVGKICGFIEALDLKVENSKDIVNFTMVMDDQTRAEVILAVSQVLSKRKLELEQCIMAIVEP